MEILAPIDQLGWRSACSGVACCSCSMAPGAERAARGGQHDALDAFGRRAAQRLQRRRMLAVDGQQLGAGIGHGRHEHVAGGDEAFLVGEGQPPPLPRGLEGRLEACRADDRRHDAVGRLGGGCDDGRRPGRGARCRVPGQRRPQLVVTRRVADHGEARMRAARRLRQRRDVALRGERDDLEGVSGCARRGRACSCRWSRWRRGS